MGEEPPGVELCAHLHIASGFSDVNCITMAQDSVQWLVVGTWIRGISVANVGPCTMEAFSKVSQLRFITTFFCGKIKIR
jgi:hypothetical protein